MRAAHKDRDLSTGRIDRSPQARTHCPTSTEKLKEVVNDALIGDLDRRARSFLVKIGAQGGLGS